MTPAGAVVLVSGGLDSATVLAIAQAEGYRCHALSFRYGQRHDAEIEAARRVVATAGVEDHVVVDIDLRAIGGSALTDDALAVPTHDRVEDLDPSLIPVTYVPARNTIFLSFALGWAEVLGADHLFLGVNALDYSGYPDCRPEFLSAFESLANVATKAAVADGRRIRVHAPLLELDKAAIVARALALGVELSNTRTCYSLDADGVSCGRCDACLLRRRGFELAGEVDPIPYRRAP